MNSWNTTVAGVSAIAVAVFGALQLLVDGDVATNPDYNAVVAAVVAGIGLTMARDNSKRSEDVIRWF